MLQPQEERDRIIICNEVLSDIRKLYPSKLETHSNTTNRLRLIPILLTDSFRYY